MFTIELKTCVQFFCTKNSWIASAVIGICDGGSERERALIWFAPLSGFRSASIWMAAADEKLNCQHAHTLIYFDYFPWHSSFLSVCVARPKKRSRFRGLLRKIRNSRDIKTRKLRNRESYMLYIIYNIFDISHIDNTRKIAN